MGKIKRKSNGMYTLNGKPLFGVSLSRNVQYVDKLVKDYNSTSNPDLLKAIEFLNAYEQAEKSNIKALDSIVGLTDEQKKDFYNSRNAERRDFYSKFYVEELNALEKTETKKIPIKDIEEQSIPPVKTFSVEELAKLNEEYFKKNGNGGEND